jgi:RNA polymerase sigma factor (sigma-70 family)
LICPAKTAQELLAEFRSTGRQEPFEEIVRRYAAMVFHICFQVLANRHDAEDATQAVFLTLAVQGKTSKPIHNIGPWLQQVAKRLSLDLKKSRSRRIAREQRHGAANGGSAALALESGLDQQELRHILSEELNHLAPKYRLPLILHYFGGLSREQMSRELGCKPATLGVRLHRGREMLAARLSQRGVALSVSGLGLLLSHMVREAVTESMVWTTSHAATQMAAGGTINAGMISARVMALARGAHVPLALAKMKGVIAAMLIAGTAVAAGEVAFKVRPLELKLQSPSTERLRDLLRPKIPDFRSDATLAQPKTRETQVVVAQTPNEIKSSPVKAIAPLDPPVVLPAANADWGGSITAGRWISSSSTTDVPGILWSTASAPPAFVGSGIRSNLVGPVSEAIAGASQRQRSVPIMMNAPAAANQEDDATLATVPQKRREPRRTQGGGANDQRLQMQPAPTQQQPSPQPTQPPADPQENPLQHPTLVQFPHPPVEVPLAIALGPAGFDGRVPRSTPSFNQNRALGPHTNSAHFSGGSVSYTDTIANDNLNVPNSIGQPPNPLIPAIQPKSRIEQWATPTMNTQNGVLHGYGTGQSASHFDHSGQVIADGYGEHRTLDLSAVGAIRNRVSNPPNGHNGWFAQRRGKLVLPDAPVAGGVATWGEDPADPQLDLVNSVRVTVDPALVGNVKLALLAADRTDYPALPSGLKTLGLWEIDAVDFVLADAGITVRYDSGLASDLQVTNNLSLWGYDGQWTLADTIVIDRTNRLISGELSGVSLFAVAGSTINPQPAASFSATPEPSAMAGLLSAGLLLLRRRRRE